MGSKTGLLAEIKAAGWLEDRGFQILDRNWHNRWCEIDLVARRGEVIHIIEVKFRANPNYGSGFDYINRDKLDRLQRAASRYMIDRNQPYQIDVVAIDSESIQLVENVTA